jgi:LmbE family N-acetylglucosaminyl deacetylase
MALPSLWVVAHPDDETLAMGTAITEHVAAGQDVHVLWLTRGIGSSVHNVLNGAGVNAWWGLAHDPAAEGYTLLTEAEFGAARIREAGNAVRCLASGLPGTLTTHEAYLTAVTPQDAESAILAVADTVAPGAPMWLKTHTPIVDNHPDHIAAGQAVQSLVAADPVRFANPRYYVLPPYWSDSRLSQVAEKWDYPTDTGITVRAKNACRAFAAWSPPYTYAIGYHSVPSYFAAIDSNPRCMYHP